MFFFLFLKNHNFKIKKRYYYYIFFFKKKVITYWIIDSLKKLLCNVRFKRDSSVIAQGHAPTNFLTPIVIIISTWPTQPMKQHILKDHIYFVNKINWDDNWFSYFMLYDNFSIIYIHIYMIQSSSKARWILRWVY